MMKMGISNRLIYDERLLKLCKYWSRMRAKTRRKHIEKISAESDLSINVIYSAIRGYRECGRAKLANRTDKGKPRNLSREEKEHYVKAVMGLKAYDPSKPNKKTSAPNKAMSTRRVLEIAENMGIVKKGLLNVRKLNRWAQELELTVKHICAARPSVKLVSLYPNHVHLVDCSVCNQYYLREKDGKIITRPWTYKNKPNESKMKIWAFALVDHYSGVKFVKYYLSPGESSLMIYKGLREAWSKKDDAQFPFHGAPKYLIADKGSALGSKKIQKMLEVLGVEVIKHKPGNPRAKGMVESAFKHIQVDFENELKYCPAQTIEELNDRMYNWLLYNNWSTASKEKKERFAKWQEITNEQLMALPSRDILAKVTASHEIRTVSAYCTISLHGETFGVPADIVDKKVRVWNNIDGGITVQDIETGEMYRDVEQKTAVFGTYNAHKKSAAERRQDDAVRMGIEISKGMTPAVLRRETPNRYAFPQTGTPIEVDSDLVPFESEEFTTKYQAKLAIADELRINLGDLDEWMLEEINKRLDETLKKDDVYLIARAIEDFMREVKAG